MNKIKILIVEDDPNLGKILLEYLEAKNFEISLAVDGEDGLDKFEAFASFFGADFYGLERNSGKITLIKNAVDIPKALPFGNDKIVPMQAGKTCAWQLKH